MIHWVRDDRRTPVRVIQLSKLSQFMVHINLNCRTLIKVWIRRIIRQNLQGPWKCRTHVSHCGYRELRKHHKGLSDNRHIETIRLELGSYSGHRGQLSARENGDKLHGRNVRIDNLICERGCHLLDPMGCNYPLGQPVTCTCSVLSGAKERGWKNPNSQFRYEWGMGLQWFEDWPVKFKEYVHRVM